MNNNKLILLAAFITTLMSSGLSACASHSTILPSFRSQPQSSADNSSLATWNKLQHTSVARLSAQSATTQDPAEKGWLSLALLAKTHSTSSTLLAQSLKDWRARYPDHPGNALFPADDTLTQLQSASKPRQIALLLPQTGPYSASGQAVRDGFLHAYYANHGNRPRLKFYDTAAAQSMPALYQQALTDGADFIIGPLTRENVRDLSQPGTFPVPTLALNYDEVKNTPRSANFYEFGLLPDDEAAQMADRAREAGLSHALIIAPQNPWGQRLAATLNSRWQTAGGTVQDTLYFNDKDALPERLAELLKVDPVADKKRMQHDNHKQTLEQQRRHDFDVIFLLGSPSQARAIIPLLHYYYVSDIPIYATSAVHADNANRADTMDLNGVTICDIPAINRLSRSSSRLYAVGQDAYRLSQAWQRLAQLPHFPFYGSTGALSVTAQQQIHRRLPCVAFNDAAR